MRRLGAWNTAATAAIAFLFLTAAIAAGSSTASAQDPLPFPFMHNATPGFAPPDDGASVLVVEGVGTGLGGCSSSDSLSATDNLNLINEITILNIEAHKPTVTEISPQAPCDSNLQDWKNVILQIETDVEQSAGADAATWWGGIMLDEETGADYGFSVGQYEDLNT
jgi:hypothetical protein